MNILLVLLVIVLFGLGLWAINTYIPMSAGFKKILNVTAAIIMIIWLLKVFGVLGGIIALFHI